MSAEVTVLLQRLNDGDEAARDALFEHVYAQLRGLARAKMAAERANHTLQPTALAHEAFLKLLGQDRVRWQGRAHFLSVAALAMRRILVNHAKAKLADKRGGDTPLVTFDEQGLAPSMKTDELLALDAALDELSQRSERPAQVVIHKFFGGLTDREVAEVLSVSTPTVRRDWRFARAWLMNRLSADRPETT